MNAPKQGMVTFGLLAGIGQNLVELQNIAHVEGGKYFKDESVFCMFPSLSKRFHPTATHPQQVWIDWGHQIEAPSSLSQNQKLGRQPDPVEQPQLPQTISRGLKFQWRVIPAATSTKRRVTSVYDSVISH